jgi:DNA-binding helix-hairpin-helix protein with protein kinase domain
MTEHVFQSNFSDNRRVSLIGSSILLGTLLIVGGAYLFGKGSFKWFAFLFAVLAVGTIIGILGYLYTKYRGEEVVSDKSAIVKDLKVVKAQISKVDKELNQISRLRGMIHQESKNQSDLRQAVHDSLIKQLDARRDSIRASERNELDATLTALQADFVEQGMMNATIQSAQISGVGPKLKERLKQSGIQNALQVSAGRVETISGFGEAKVSAVLYWKQSVQSELDRTKPLKIHDDQEDQIRSRYRLQVNETDMEEGEAFDNLSHDLEAIRDEARSRHKVNERQEVEAKLRRDE